MPDLAPDSALPRLRQVVDEVRATDHEMNGQAPADQMLAYAAAAERLIGRVGRADRHVLGKAIAEAYQLAGWMSFDAGRAEPATSLFTTSRQGRGSTAEAGGCGSGGSWFGCWGGGWPRRVGRSGC